MTWLWGNFTLSEPFFSIYLLPSITRKRKRVFKYGQIKITLQTSLFRAFYFSIPILVLITLISYLENNWKIKINSLQLRVSLHHSYAIIPYCFFLYVQLLFCLSPDLCFPLNSAIHYTSKQLLCYLHYAVQKNYSLSFKNMVSRERLPVYILDFAFQMLIYHISLL